MTIEEQPFTRLATADFDARATVSWFARFMGSERLVE